MKLLTTIALMTFVLSMAQAHENAPPTCYLESQCIKAMGSCIYGDATKYDEGVYLMDYDYSYTVKNVNACITATGEVVHISSVEYKGPVHEQVMAGKVSEIQPKTVKTCLASQADTRQLVGTCPN